MDTAKKGVEKVTGRLSLIRFSNEPFHIMELDNGITVKGDILSPQIGQEYTFEGEWVQYDKYGPSFKFESFVIVKPNNTSAIKAYLIETTSWIGQKTANLIIDAFGLETLKILKNNPGDVALKIKGITLKRAEEISTMLVRNEKNEKLMIQLKELFDGTGISKRAVSQIIKKYKTDAVNIINTFPYKLIEDIDGVGFTIADNIAIKNGLPTNSKARIQAYIIHLLKNEWSSQGHTCIQKCDLIDETQNKLLIDTDLINEVVEDLVKKQTLKVYKDNDGIGFLYLQNVYDREQNIANKLRALQAAKIDKSDIEIKVDDLMEDQVDALKQAIANNVFILTGAPGTGKTYTIKRIIETLSDCKIALAAPTGKAAKRVEEQTGRSALTIHRLLSAAFDNGKFYFERNADSPIDADVIILDEVSMVDNSLMSSFLDAVKLGTRLIFIGDTYQLPSIGAGNILKDMIASKQIPIVELTIIKRQGAESRIVTNCHRIKNGDDIEVDNIKTTDFYFLKRADETSIQDMIKDLVLNRLPEAGHDPLKDIQVISPLNESTSLSCNSLNKLLQAELIKIPLNKNSHFKVGDKVIQTQNDYILKIINGDIGYITSINFKEKMLYIDFENPARQKIIPLYDNKLKLAYCVTCHKFQGSEAPVVIIPIHKCLGALVAQRNWLYTAISRAKQICILVGQRDEVKKIISRNYQQKRWTNLVGFLSDR